MKEGEATLAYPVRLSVVGHYLGQLGAMLAILCVPACLVALFSGELRAGITYGLIAAALLITAWSQRRPDAVDTIQRNEGMVIVGSRLLCGR